MHNAINLKKILFVILGTLSLGLGIIGVFVPGLPTTPFLLLTAALYIRSSKRLHQKLISNKFIGSYINDFHTKKGMSTKEKIRSLALMWFMITISLAFFIEIPWVKLIVVFVGLIGTVVMGFVVKTVKTEIKPEK